MTMRQLLLRRLPQTLLVAVGVGLVAFFITRLLPGDAASTWAGPRASREELALVREQLGLDLPLPEQVVRYLVGLASGDWGISIHTRQPVIEDVMGRLVASLELVGVAMLIAVVGGIFLGMVGARWKGRWPDWLSSALTAILVSAPIFWLGLLLQLTVATELDLLPVAGRYDREFRDVVADDRHHRPGHARRRSSPSTARSWLRRPRTCSCRRWSWRPIPPGSSPVCREPASSRRWARSTCAWPGPSASPSARSCGASRCGRRWDRCWPRWRSCSATRWATPSSSRTSSTGRAWARTWPTPSPPLTRPRIAGATVVVAIAYLLANLVVDIVRPIVDPRLRMTTIDDGPHGHARDGRGP